VIDDSDLVFDRFSYGVGDFNEMVGPVRVERAEVEAVALTHGLLLVDLGEFVSKASQLETEAEAYKSVARARGETILSLSDKLCACEAELESATIRGRELVEEAEQKTAELEKQLEEAERVRVELAMDLQFGRVPAEYRELLAGHIKWLGEATLAEKG
jgi:predicted RNase H-like nuclease (RuvC/YqgF family)